MLVIIRRNKEARILRNKDRIIAERQSISRVLKHQVRSRSRQRGRTLVSCHTEGLLEFEKRIQEIHYKATGCLMYQPRSD